MDLPFHDWQFWVATAIALAALGFVIRPLWPSRSKRSGPCPGCPTGAAAQRPKRTAITIEGRGLS